MDFVKAKFCLLLHVPVNLELETIKLLEKKTKYEFAKHEKCKERTLKFG